MAIFHPVRPPKLALLVLMALATGALSTASPARAGQLRVDTIPLKQAAGRAVAAVVVKLDTPARRRADLPIAGTADKACEPYPSSVWKGRVVAVAKAPARSGLEVGAPLTIYYALAPLLVELEGRSCREGVSKSVAVQRFDGAEPSDGAELLVLLRWQPPYGWVEAVQGAWLPPRRAKAVAKMMISFGLQTPLEGPAGASELLCVEDADCELATLACSPCGICPNAPREAHHVTTVSRYEESCRAQRAQDKGPPPDCEPCPTPSDVKGPLPSASCRAMRCVVSTP